MTLGVCARLVLNESPIQAPSIRGEGGRGGTLLAATNFLIILDLPITIEL